ncbi:MAG: type 1 glutamine amidotransferase [Chloroflexi bacterium]|nr:type 1 glutamine amidotransferase [Chloroflexota bacterium]
MKRVLILQHEWDNPSGLVGEILQEYHIASDTIHVRNAPIPESIAYDAIVAFGGSQHVYEEDKYPYFTQEKTIIRQAVEQDIPYLGICLGGQLLAGALNSPVRQHSMTELGFFTVHMTEAGKADPLYAGLPGYQTVFHWHADTFDIPAGAILLATNENTENQAFRYGPRAYGLQYHIEVTPEMLDTWLYHPDLKESIIGTIGIDGYTTIERERPIHYPTYEAHTRIIFKNFLRISGLI